MNCFLCLKIHKIPKKGPFGHTETGRCTQTCRGPASQSSLPASVRKAERTMGRTRPSAPAHPRPRRTPRVTLAWTQVTGVTLPAAAGSGAPLGPGDGSRTGVLCTRNNLECGQGQTWTVLVSSSRARNHT